MIVNKADYRQKAIKTLTTINQQYKAEIEQQLLCHLLATDVWIKAQTIGISISLDYEWDTEPIIRAAWEKGKDVCVPKCYPERHKMHFFKLTSFSELENVYYQLQEPNPKKAQHIKKDKIDLLIVPGLYFDSFGYRIGFGGGYYDRYLKGFENPSLSLTSTLLVESQLPRDAFDIPVKHLMTEKGLIK